MLLSPTRLATAGKSVSTSVVVLRDACSLAVACRSERESILLQPPPLFRYLVRSFTILLPYFPTGTMERVDKEGQICTAKVRACGWAMNLLLHLCVLWAHLTRRRIRTCVRVSVRNRVGPDARFKM